MNEIIEYILSFFNKAVPVPVKEVLSIEDINRAKKIKEEIKIFNKRADDLINETNRKNKEEIHKKNNICPSCSGTNVNDRIKQQEGEISGHTSSYGGGSMSGNFKTVEVNKCNDCHNEWKKEKDTSVISRYSTRHIVRHVVTNLVKYHEAINCTYDPLDLSEKYGSHEEKREKLISESENPHNMVLGKQLLDGLSFDTFIELCTNNEDYVDDYEYYRKKIDEHYNEYYLSLYGLTKLNYDE